MDGCAEFVGEVASQYPDFAKARIARLFVESVELAAMHKPLYVAWQDFLRFIHPDRPILLDTIWATRRNLVASA